MGAWRQIDGDRSEIGTCISRVHFAIPRLPRASGFTRGTAIGHKTRDRPWACQAKTELQRWGTWGLQRESACGADSMGRLLQVHCSLHVGIGCGVVPCKSSFRMWGSWDLVICQCKGGAWCSNLVPVCLRTTARQS